MVDNKEILKCPACGKEMVKVFIKSANKNVDICLNGCGGIYFDNKEFFLFDEQHENISEIIEALKDKQFEYADLEKERYCPYCGSKMVKNFTSASKEIAVDDCYNCGGKFLDYGELEKIRMQFSTAQERTNTTREKIFNSDKYNELSAKAPDRIYKKSFMRKAFDKIYNRISSYINM